MFVIRSQSPPLYVRGSKIVRPGRGFRTVRARGRLVPGLIDIHINGCYGIDFGRASVEEMLDAARRLARLGVTAFMPTVISQPRRSTREALETIETARRLQRDGAEILGAHMEGPLLSPERAGAHRVAHLRRPARDEWSRARMITVAPERRGALELIRSAARAGKLVAIGHSDADAATAAAAVRAGARLVCHLYNAMRGLHHRDESILNVALTDPRLACELIYDGRHVSRSAARIALACKGAGGIVLVSDGTAAIGGRRGSFRSGGVRFSVRNGRVVDGRGRLGGSASTLADVVRRAVRDLSEDAVTMATRNPARLLGIKKGEIKPGYDADLILVDDRMNVRATWVRGELVTSEKGAFVNRGGRIRTGDLHVPSVAR